MTTLKAICAALLLALLTPLALAQSAKPGAKPDEEKKTETKPEAKPEPKAGENAEAKPMDRGDEKAEKLLKKAWQRVHSAETDGLQRLKAGAKISVDASAFGMGPMEFDGNLLWAAGKKAVWNAKETEGGEANPMGNVSNIAKSLFEPYLAYVGGFPAWDSKFKECSFAMGEATKDEKGAVKADNVIVTFKDEHKETYSVAENKIPSMATEAEMQGQKSQVLFTYTYEDLGKKLRLTKVVGTTKIDMTGLPGQPEDPKNPVPKGSTEEALEGSIEITKYGKAGEYEIALEMKGGIKLMGMEFPTTMALSDTKVNKDVSDDDLKPLEDENAGGEEKKPEDDEF